MDVKPFKKDEKPFKMNLILDLDATLICSKTSKKFDFKKNNNMSKASKFKFHDMDGYYVVFERPGLQEFLDYVFKKFNVSIWTAASKDYGLYIIDNIILDKNKPHRKLDWAFFSYHCDISKEKKDGKTKSLEMLWDEYKINGFNKDNTYILDDYKEVFKTQMERCFWCTPFAFHKDGSENDDYLKRLQNCLQNHKLGDSAESVNKQIGATH